MRILTVAVFCKVAVWYKMLIICATPVYLLILSFTLLNLLLLLFRIISSLSNRKVTIVCLFDLSIAFDTIAYSVLVHRLSTCHGLSGLIPSWIKSYLLAHNFQVIVDVLIYSYSPQYSTKFCPWPSSFSILLISAADSSINHQSSMLMSSSAILFSPLDFCINILSLQNTVISNWMSTSLLSSILKLSFLSLFYLSNFLNGLILAFPWHLVFSLFSLMLFVTLMLSSILISQYLNIFLMNLKPISLLSC